MFNWCDLICLWALDGERIILWAKNRLGCCVEACLGGLNRWKWVNYLFDWFLMRWCWFHVTQFNQHKHHSPNLSTSFNFDFNPQNSHRFISWHQKKLWRSSLRLSNTQQQTRHFGDAPRLVIFSCMSGCLHLDFIWGVLLDPHNDGDGGTSRLLRVVLRFSSPVLRCWKRDLTTRCC